MAIGLAIFDGPPEGEVIGSHLYSGSIVLGCFLTVLLVVFCYRENAFQTRLVAHGLWICSVFNGVAVVIYMSAARRLRPRAYISLPLPLLLWVVAAQLILWQKRDTDSRSNLSLLENLNTVVAEDDGNAEPSND